MQRVGMFSDALASTPAMLAAARLRFEHWMASEKVEPEVADDLAVVVSELGANAVAAATSPEARIEVRAWWEGSELVLEVENEPGSGAGRVVFHTDDDPLRGYGQGLLIVTAFTDSVEVVPPDGERGLVVRCRRDVEGRC